MATAAGSQPGSVSFMADTSKPNIPANGTAVTATAPRRGMCLICRQRTMAMKIHRPTISAPWRMMQQTV